MPYDAAMRMPVEIRHWWAEQLSRENQEKNEEMERLRNKGR